MPTWVKYGIVFILGVVVGQNPNVLTSVGHSIGQFLTGIGHG